MRKNPIVLPLFLLAAAACAPSALPLREDASSAASALAAEAPVAAVTPWTGAREDWVIPVPTPAPSGAAHDHAATAAPAESRPAAELYTCSMHPEVRSREPGKCPSCGMTLERVKETP